MPAFFDFHVHCSLKSFLSGSNEADRLKAEDQRKHLFQRLSIRGSLRQLQQGKVKLAVAVLYPLERAFAGINLVQKLFPFISYFDHYIVREIASNKLSYYDLLLQELKHLHATGKKLNIHFPHNFKEFDDRRLNILTAVEGAHAFLTPDRPPAELFDKYLKTETPPVYLGLAHLQRSPIVNHADAIKLLNSRPEFQPHQFGIEGTGFQIISRCCRNEPPVLIDVKHLSLVSRMQLYNWRQKQGVHSPLVASHAAATGISWRHVNSILAKAPQRLGRLVELNYHSPRGIQMSNQPPVSFNPRSINLYDEDITEIIRSGGLIGLNLDQRVLGGEFNVSEYIHGDEWEIISDFQEDTETSLIKPVNQLLFKIFNNQLLFLVNNLLHIIKIGGAKAWKQVVIGSDFDGFIAPLNKYDSATCYQELESGFNSCFTGVLKQFKSKGLNLAEEYHIRDVNVHTRDLFYNNGYNFLQKHLSN